MDTTWTLRFIVCLLCCRASLAELKEPAGEGGLTNVRIIIF
uniref:Uncharacterized protein n=1 Tax=Apis cerana TaxID=7461 RepID=V9ID32_APICE